MDKSLYPETLEQFEISDEHDTNAIKEMIENQGYEVVWKDWDSNYFGVD
ncbi:MAG: hypothetical protein ABJL44_18845 [Algibacter sp.]